MDLKGKVALVTGGASGIGLSCCEELLKYGAKVSICDIDSEQGENAVEELGAKYGKKNIIYCQCDVTDYLQFEESFEMTQRAYGGIDVVVNNAGVMNDRFWELEVDVNLNGVIRGTMLAYRYMAPRGGGTVVNVASVASVRPQVATPVYTATQHAIVGLTKSYGDPYHVALTNVRCFALCPSITSTAFLKDVRKQLLSVEFEAAWQRDNEACKPQSSDHVGKCLIEVLAKAKSGSVWIVENELPPREHR